MDIKTAVAALSDQKSCEEAAQRIAKQITDLMSSNAAKYGANANLTSAALYTYIRVNVTDKSVENEFSGHAGSGGTPGIGVYGGHLYCDDLPRLYRDTYAFQFNVNPFWASVVYFDGNSNVLGTFQGGGVGLISNIGGGNGSWVRKVG